MSAEDTTNDPYRAVREQAHGDAEGIADDMLMQFPTAAAAAADSANDRGYPFGSAERQAYVDRFIQVWHDWREHGYCTHRG